MTERVYNLLNGPRLTRQLIRAKKEKREALISSLTSGCIRYDKPAVQVSPGDRIADVMAEVDEIDRAIQSFYRMLDSRELLLKAYCQSLKPQQARVIRMYYLGKSTTWTDVSSAMRISRRKAIELRDNAVDQLEDYMRELYDAEKNEKNA